MHQPGRIKCFATDLGQSLGWDVLLDAAAFAPTNRLDLTAVRPDFVALSYYKNLPAVEIGLRHLENVGRDLIHERVACLTGWLLIQLGALLHSNGAPAVRIYGPNDGQRRGGTVICDFLTPEGALVDYRPIEALANARHISLRTGSFCNPGAGEIALNVTEAELNRVLTDDTAITLPELVEALDRVIGALRISVGMVTNLADLHTFIRFAHDVTNDVAAGVLHAGPRV